MSTNPGPAEGANQVMAQEHSAGAVQFTAHNVRLDDGTLTIPESSRTLDESSWFISARGILETVFPGDKSHLRLADVGCLEGGYAVGFARMGFQVLGIEVRELNMAACNYIKSKTNLPNLRSSTTTPSTSPTTGSSIPSSAAASSTTWRIRSNTWKPSRR